MIDSPAQSSACLIVADDSADMRWVIREALSESHFEVIEAVDGRELFWALERCAAMGANTIVIADICMPIYSGLEVLEAWDIVKWRFPFIVITGTRDAAIRARAERQGAILLSKPFAMTELRDAVARFAQ